MNEAQILHKPFYFMRHGETDWNKQHLAMGQKDIPLNQDGIKSAYDSIELLKNIGLHSIAVSPLDRARKTAEIIASKIPATITIIDDLKECKWGVIEGQCTDGYNSELFTLWRKNEPVEGAELISTFKQRVINAVNQALKLPDPVLIISHGGVYWCIQDALGLSDSVAPNCVPIFHRPPENNIPRWLVNAV